MAEELIIQLGAMGFPRERAAQALHVLGPSADTMQALDWLLAHPESEEVAALPPAVDLAPNPLSSSASGTPPPPPPPEAPPQPPVEPFKLSEGCIPPEAPPPPQPLVFVNGELVSGAPAAPAADGVSAKNAFADRIAETASVRGVSNYQPKGAAGMVGLQNQGATCYLNSLLQTLYFDPVFRRLVYEWRYDERKDGPPAQCLPFQLQLLFAQLQIGDNGVAKTGPLTESFGWVNGEQYQQHDVQELMRVLLNAVEVSFKERVTDADSRVTPVYSGSFEDYLQCQSCGHRRSRNDPFMDIQLFIERANSLQEALVTFVTPEMLEGDNRVTCEGCGAKCDAKKGLMIRSLPQVLTLQLKRFTYDPRTWQRVKLSKRVVYPLYVDFSPYVGTTTVAGVNPQAAPAPGDAAPPSVDPAHSVLEEIKNRTKPFAGKVGKDEAKHWDAVESGAAAAPAAAADDDGADDAAAGVARPTDAQLATPGAQWYELFSVLIHSGGAMGGHYYSYTKDTHTGKWYNFNDMDVRAISERDARRMCGQDGASVSSTNAYMLLYRRMAAGESLRIDDAAVPDYIRKLIETENDEIKDKKRDYEEAMKNVSVNVYRTLGDRDEAPQVMLLDRTLSVEAAALEMARRLQFDCAAFEYRVRGYLPKRGKVTGESFAGREKDSLHMLAFHNNKNVFLERKRVGEDWKVDVPSVAVEVVMANQGKARFEAPRFVSVRSNATVRQLMNVVYGMWKGRGIFVDANDIALVRIHGESFEHTSRAGNWRKPLSELGIVDGARVYAESRMRGEDDGLLEKVDWTDLSPTLTEDALDADSVYGDAASLVTLESDEEMCEWNSFVVQQFEVQRNTIELYYNIPPPEGTAVSGEPKMDQMVEMDQRLPLRELRAKIAAALQLDANKFIMRKNLDKKEYRDDDLSLVDLKLYNGNALLLERGTPLALENFRLRFYTFSLAIDGDAAFQYVGELGVRKDQTLASLKRAILEWQQRPADGEYVRLCERNGYRCARVLLGDARQMWDVCPHLRDGFELVIQYTRVPDNLGFDDMVVHLKRWNKDGSGQLQQGVDELVLPKGSTLFQVRQLVAEHAGLPAERVAISKPFRSLLAQLATVLEAIQSVNWDVDLQCVAAKSPWYLTSGELIMYKDKADVEKMGEFLNSMYSGGGGGGGPSGAHHRAEPALRILTKFDHAESREASTPQSPVEAELQQAPAAAPEKSE